jgi:hypothetical protein
LSRVDALANPAFQRTLQLVLAVVAVAGAVMVVVALWSARRPMSTSARVLRKRVGAIGLFVAVAAGAAYGVLSTPVDPGPGAQTTGAPPEAPGDEVATAQRFSSARLPALSLDAPPGWALVFDEKGRKLSAGGETARLVISSAVLADAVDVEALLRRMTDSQRTLGFDVKPLFTERIGELPAAGFLATGTGRSVCTWMVKRDAHLATSLICSADGKTPACDVCRAVVANVRWRAPERR